MEMGEHIMDKMTNLLSLIACMLMLPIIYSVAILYYRYYFIEQKNKTRKPLKSMQEKIVMLISELAIVRLWFVFDKCNLTNFQFVMLILILYGVTILCIMDYWEKVVPNCILLFFLLLWVVCTGLYGVRNVNGIIQYMYGVILGVVFCMISFGFCYLISRGSMGAGDVKLSIIMALYMTGNYVVGSVFYACIISAIYSIVMLLAKKISRKSSIPFVPFLYLGMIVRYFLG